MQRFRFEDSEKKALKAKYKALAVGERFEVVSDIDGRDIVGTYKKTASGCRCTQNACKNRGFGETASTGSIDHCDKHTLRLQPTDAKQSLGLTSFYPPTRTVSSSKGNTVLAPPYHPSLERPRKSGSGSR